LDINKKSQHFTTKGISPKTLLIVSILFGIIGILIWTLLSLHLFVYGSILILISASYSYPFYKREGKVLPAASSIGHILAALVAFLSSYGLIGEIDLRGILIGLYFSLICTAGHLVQEVQDYSEDKKNKLKTHAVRYGQKPVLLSSFLLFSISFAYLFYLSYADFLSVNMKYIICLYPVYVYMLWQNIKSHNVNSERI